MIKMSLTETPIKFSVEINGNIPNNLADLESLPGVGHKTASVVLLCLVLSGNKTGVDEAAPYAGILYPILSA